MKRIIACIAVVLWTVSVMAERVRVEQDFNSLFQPPAQLEITNGNKDGKTDFATYKCSEGGSAFSIDAGGKLAVFLENGSAQVVTSKIKDLEELDIYFISNDKSSTLNVYFSEDSISWRQMDVVEKIDGLFNVKALVRGNYNVKIVRGSYKTYIRRIDFVLEDCHALEVTRSEE